MNRLLLLLPLAAVLGCAAPAPTTYAQGIGPAAPAFPTPPLTPTGTGAPMVGQPGASAPERPRSPHERELPPTREPGLWAGDAPRASRATPRGEPRLLGVVLPVLPVSDTETDVGPARACAALWNEALAGSELVEKVNALRPDVKRCMVAYMFNVCTRSIEELDDASREKGVIVLLARQKRAQLREAAEDFVDDACTGRPWTDDHRRLLDKLISTLRKTLSQE
jgi:hypothetical protein